MPTSHALPEVTSDTSVTSVTPVTSVTSVASVTQANEERSLVFEDGDAERSHSFSSREKARRNSSPEMRRRRISHDIESAPAPAAARPSMSRQTSGADL